MKWRTISSIVQEGALPSETVLSYGIQMAELIHEMHLHSGMIAELRLADFYVQPDGKLHWSAGAYRNTVYRAPEQFGLAGVWPDERSDLYALGVMLYEMLTGQPPLEPEEGQTWREFHMLGVVRPFPPVAGEGLSALIARALAVSPQARYQTAYGMLMDMKLLQANPKRVVTELFRYDRRCRLRQPDRLLGRAAELAALQQHAAAVRSGGRQALLVCGTAGAGKSRLLSEWRQQLLREGELAARVPAAARTRAATRIDQAVEQGEILAQAAEQWEQQWLCREPGSTSPSAWSEAHPQQPLILIVDAMGAAHSTAVDEACLWLEREESGASRLLVVVCADDVQRERAHRCLQEASVQVSSMELQPLDYGAVLEWTADVLQDMTSRASVWAGVVYQWSGGMPGEIVACLERWHADGSLAYSYERHRWEWAEELVTGAPLSAGYVQSMERLLLQLPPQWFEPLERAALIGMRFSLSVLAELLVADGGWPQLCVAKEQASSVQEEAQGLPERKYAAVSPERDHSVEALGVAALHELLSEAARLGILCPEEGDNWLFLSALVQAKLYLRTPQAQRSSWHIRIGELYDKRVAESGESEEGEQARRHLNLGAEHLPRAHRRELAARNYEAGKLASRNGGLAQAIHDMEQALKLAWDGEQVPDELACKIGSELYALLHYSGDVDRALPGLAWVREHIDKLAPPDRLRACLSQQDIFATYDGSLALAISRDTLIFFGWTLPERVPPLRAVVEAVRAVLAARKADKQDDQIAENQQLAYVAQCRLLLGQIFPLSASDPAMLLYAFAQLVRRGLSQGRNEYFLNVLDAFEMLLQRGLPGLYRIWPKHLRTVWSSGLRARSVQQSKLLFMDGMLKQLEQPAEMISSLERVLSQAKEQNQVTLFNLTAVTYMITTWGTARQLRDTLTYLEQEAAPMLDETALRVLQLMKLYLHSCEEDEAWQHYSSPSGWELDRIQPDHVDYMLRSEQAYLYGRYEDALYFARKASEMELGLDWIRNRRARLLEALAMIALYGGTAKERRAQSKAIRHRLKQIESWQGYLGTGSSACWLLRAEWARVNGEHRAALLAYEQASAAAKHEMPNIFQPLSLERMALYHRNQGMRTGSLIALLEAMTAYSSCGYPAKRNQLEREHPELAATAYPLQADRNHALPLGLRADKRDEREQSMPEALPPSAQQQDELLAIACRKAGADRGMLLELAGEESPRVLTRYGARHAAAGGWAQGVVRAAWARKERIVLKDAQESEFLADPHIAQGTVRSVLSLPVRLPGSRHPAALYLENTQIAGLFSTAIADDIEALLRSFMYRALLEQPAAAGWGSYSASQMDGGVDSQTADVLIDALSERETEVLQAIVAGHSNREIAELLNITEATVKSHAHHVYTKLGVKRRGQAIARARELNLTRRT